MNNFKRREREKREREKKEKETKRSPILDPALDQPPGVFGVEGPHMGLGCAPIYWPQSLDFWSLLSLQLQE